MAVGVVDVEVMGGGKCVSPCNPRGYMYNSAGRGL
jgi:hypothetical protein